MSNFYRQITITTTPQKVYDIALAAGYTGSPIVEQEIITCDAGNIRFKEIQTNIATDGALLPAGQPINLTSEVVGVDLTQQWVVSDTSATASLFIQSR